MICIPKKNTALNFFVVFFLFVLVSVIYSFSLMEILPDIVWQIAFFFSALLLIELSTKFFLPVYTYILDDDVFKITKTMGKKITIVAAIDVDKIDDVLLRAEYKKQDASKIKSVYNYNANLISASCYVLLFSYSNTKEAVFFEPTQKFVDLLKGKINSVSF